MRDKWWTRTVIGALVIGLCVACKGELTFESKPSTKEMSEACRAKQASQTTNYVTFKLIFHTDSMCAVSTMNDTQQYCAPCERSIEELQEGLQSLIAVPTGQYLPITQMESLAPGMVQQLRHDAILQHLEKIEALLLEQNLLLLAIATEKTQGK